MDKIPKHTLVIFATISIVLLIVFAAGALYIRNYEEGISQGNAPSHGWNMLADVASILVRSQATVTGSTTAVASNPGIFSDLFLPSSNGIISAMLGKLNLSSLLTQNSSTASSSGYSSPILTGSFPAPLATSIQNLGSQSVFSNWIVGPYSTSTLVADTSLYTEGNQSLSLTTDGMGDAADARVINQGPYNLTNKYLEVWIRVSAATNIDDLWFSVSSDNLHANYYTWRLNRQIVSSPDESEIQAGEWVPIVLPFDSDGTNMVTIGAPNLAALNSFELHISDRGQGPLTVWLGGISAVAEPSQGALTIVLDNGWNSEYTLAMPALSQYGFPAVIAEIPETANDPAFMTTQQLQDLQNNLGWDIACHTWDHVYQLGLSSSTIPIMDSEFTQCKNWLTQNRLAKAENVLVWPDGSNSPAAIAEASKYFVAGRGIIGTMFNTLPVANPMLLYATEFGGDTPTSTLDADVDRCMANHEWCIFYGHMLTTSTPENQDQYAAASFNDFIAHIAQVGIPVKTITQVLGNEPQLAAPSEASLQSPAGAPNSLLPVIASNISTSTLTLPLPYGESNFANDLNWQNNWGMMTIASSGVMDLGASASTTGGSVAFQNSGGWTDYKFNMTFDWLEGQTVNLDARYTDNNDYVTCEFNASTPGSVNIQLEQYINGNRYNLASGIVSGDNGIGDTNIDAYIEVRGTNEICSFNNHVVLSAGYTLNPPFNGGIGFSTWDPMTNNSQIVVKSVAVSQNY